MILSLLYKLDGFKLPMNLLFKFSGFETELGGDSHFSPVKFKTCTKRQKINHVGYRKQSTNII
jgi:hypothetical protein